MKRSSLPTIPSTRVEVQLNRKTERGFVGGKSILIFTLSGATKFNFRSEIVDFLGCRWNTLNYHLKKIERKGFRVIEAQRENFTVIKKFDNIENPQDRIILIPYTTFWALLESYKSEIAEEILKQLHNVDYERMMDDGKQQTLIEQIKGEKALSQILFEEIDKCETLHQIGLFTYLFKFFPQARVEVKFYDPDKEWEWRLDILIGNLVLELDGTQHRFKDERFHLDEEKDTFNFENGRYTFRRSNGWWERNFKKFPLMVEKFMTHHKDLL